MKKAYYYFFYKLYKWYDRGPSIWLSDWKAVASIIALEIWLYLAFISYFSVITKKATELTISSPLVFVPLTIILLVNFLFFSNTILCEHYIKEFDRLPKKKNRLGGWIVFGIVISIITNLIFSFYLMSQIDWSQYR